MYEHYNIGFHDMLFIDCFQDKVAQLINVQARQEKHIY